MVNSVIQEPSKGTVPYDRDLIISFATIADDMPVWGLSPGGRDRKLREFWPSEPILASAIFSTASRYAAFGWSLIGPDRTTNIVRRIFHGVENGAGWLNFIMKVIVDLFTQDNGAFIEVIRTANDENAPVVSLNHLDSNQCIRTGRHDEPVIYYDMYGRGHLLKWYQVICLAEFPSPIESMRGVQYCAVTRMLRAAQILRDISIYKREKISGQFTRAVHLVSGVQQKSITDAIKSAQFNAESQGLIRYIQPIVVASLDPNSTVSKETIELAALPDHFDEEISMRWYINQLALAFGGEYQDFAPLPSGNLGTSQQSKMLHLKGRGKGPKLFMNMIENVFNFQGIMPNTVTFRFGDADINEDEQLAGVRSVRATERAARIASGEIDATIARQMAVDSGDLDPKYLTYFNESDLTPDRKLSGTKEYAS
jgi:hypothetical protein